VIATALRFSGTIDALAGVDLCYAPQFGSAKDPVHLAAFIAQNVADGRVRQILPGESAGDGQLLDVRTAAEFAAGSLEGAINVPLQELRARLGELDKGRPILVMCGIGQRAYVACRILMQSGFEDVRNLAGGYLMHKEYEVQERTSAG
jgi:rhodanese-related sulfurtransferase